MPFPTPPPDNSGGYFILTYTNTVNGDAHRMRVHVRPLNSDATYSSPSATVEPGVPQTFTNLATFLKPFYSTNWTFSLTAIFKNNGDGTFTELFGWTAPASVAGTSAAAYVQPGERASQQTFTMQDAFGGRLKMILLGREQSSGTNPPVIYGGSPTGDANQKLVDYLSTASKTNIVSRNGHIAQSPARAVYGMNRRLRRHFHLD